MTKLKLAAWESFGVFWGSSQEKDWLRHTCMWFATGLPLGHRQIHYQQESIGSESHSLLTSICSALSNSICRIVEVALA